MPRIKIGRFSCVFIFFIFSLSVAALAEESLQSIKSGLLSFWLVTVEGDPRTRTLEIQDVTTKTEGKFELIGNYGWSYDARKPVKATATIRPEGLKFELTTPAHGLIVANQTEDGSFVGTLTSKDGKVTGVKLEKQPSLQAQESMGVGLKEEPGEESKRPPGVLFLHGWNRSPDAWRDFSSRLKKQGYITCVPQLPKSKPPEMLKEVDRHYELLKSQGADSKRIALIGESTGANLA
jgi:hypothetical protein